MHIKTNPDIVKEKDLPARLKECGFDVEFEKTGFIPMVGYDHENREGKFENGIIPIQVYFNVPLTIMYLKDIEYRNLVAQVKERGYELKLDWLQYLPLKSVNNKYAYNIEQIIAYITSFNFHNFVEKLHERGFEITKEDIISISSYCYDPTSYPTHEFMAYDLEKAVLYLNSVTDFNIKAVLKKHGYVIDDLFINRLISIGYANQLFSYDNGINGYNLENVLEYVKKNPPRTKITNMKNHVTQGTTQDTVETEDFFGSNLNDFYGGGSNQANNFPISKWYVEKYNTIPDSCFLRSLYVRELLNNKKFKLRWTSKYFAEFNRDTDDEDEDDMISVAVLREFEQVNKCEYVVEALLEIEDGMFLIMENGSYNEDEEDDDEIMKATCFLYYKEGINDPTDFLKYVSDFTVRNTQVGELRLLFHDEQGFNTQSFSIPQPVIDFNVNYNKGFDTVHNTISNALLAPKSKGLVLLYGKPGTGKTTYIRYLINSINKNKIFVPPNLTGMLSDPAFIPFLMRNSNSILFVEDAENVLRSREDEFHNQAVSNILNITDGLLSDCLNIQIVATFNTNLKNVDPALLRKGRLIAQYEFTELQPDRAEKLADSLKVWLDDTENLTLADIYAAKGKKS